MTATARWGGLPVGMLTRGWGWHVAAGDIGRRSDLLCGAVRCGRLRRMHARAGAGGGGGLSPGPPSLPAGRGAHRSQPGSHTAFPPTRGACPLFGPLRLPASAASHQSTAQAKPARVSSGSLSLPRGCTAAPVVSSVVALRSRPLRPTDAACPAALLAQTLPSE